MNQILKNLKVRSANARQSFIKLLTDLREDLKLGEQRLQKASNHLQNREMTEARDLILSVLIYRIMPMFLVLLLVVLTVRVALQAAFIVKGIRIQGTTFSWQTVGQNAFLALLSFVLAKLAWGGLRTEIE